MPVLRHYGNHFHQSTINAPFVTLIFGLHMSRFFPKTDAVGEESGKTNHIVIPSVARDLRLGKSPRRNVHVPEGGTPALCKFGGSA